MSIQGPFQVQCDELFVHGLFAVAVDAQQDFEKARAGDPDPQARDKNTGERVWVVRVIDNDPQARSSEFKVKVTAPVCPALPSPLPGTNFRPVSFRGLTVTPYVEETRTGRARIAYSLRATEVVEPKRGATTSSGPTKAA
jgi:hypothetical protein